MITAVIDEELPTECPKCGNTDRDKCLWVGPVYRKPLSYKTNQQDYLEWRCSCCNFLQPTTCKDSKLTLN